MRPEGPTTDTLEKIRRVRDLLRDDNKLVWACAEVGLSVQTWYRWSGWQVRRPLGRYRRQVYLRREIVTQKVKSVMAAAAAGHPAKKVCRELGLSYDTYNWRKAKLTASLDALYPENTSNE